jgi:biopolymer transport protein ExbD
MRFLRRRTRPGHVKMEFTAMIDVVFLLLVFFMCTLKFKTLEGKLATYLPKDRGPDRHFELPVPKEDIRVKLSQRGDRCLFAVKGRFLGVLPQDRDKLFDRIRGLRQALPDSPAVIDADPAVAHGNVVTVVDECIRARVAEITFAGALPELKRKG